jgi:hypothetical protein
MEQGWIYVLVNSSTPGMAKVGRTTRLPRDRAAELSAATGVPTPFVVAFDQPFIDCCEAERLVDTQRPDPSAERLCHAGDNAMYGRGETLQDTGEALRCYKLAASRGSLVAYERMGRIYVSLYQKTRNRAGRRRALNVLKEGVRRGNYYCYCEMATLFSIECHVANFIKSWDLFFARHADSPCEEIEADPGHFVVACSRYIAMMLDLGRTPGHLAELTANGEAIVTALLTELDAVRDHPPSRQRVATVMRWAWEAFRPVEIATKPKRRRLLPRWAAAA